MRYAEIGSGPLVLFCHGWPESWYSWRHQILALGAAGYRCVALICAATAAPRRRTDRALHALHLVGDMAELVKALGESRAVIVGQRLGAPVALARSTVAARSVPRRVRDERPYAARRLASMP